MEEILKEIKKNEVEGFIRKKTPPKKDKKQIPVGQMRID